MGMAEYQPHITITWDKPEDLDIASVEPFRGALRFGPEIFEVDEGWQQSGKQRLMADNSRLRRRREPPDRIHPRHRP